MSGAQGFTLMAARQDFSVVKERGRSCRRRRVRPECLSWSDESVALHFTAHLVDNKETLNQWTGSANRSTGRGAEVELINYSGDVSHTHLAVPVQWPAVSLESWNEDDDANEGISLKSSRETSYLFSNLFINSLSKDRIYLFILIIILVTVSAFINLLTNVFIVQFVINEWKASLWFCPSFNSQHS